MPRQVLIVTSILCLVAAGLGLWLGIHRTSITESDLILAAAARWSSETGMRDHSSCVAYAGSDEDVWLEVTCGMNETRRRYSFDTSGKLIDRREPGL